MSKILSFHADWCEPCSQQEPILEQIEDNGVDVEWIDVDDQTDVANEYTVRSVPTTIVLEDGDPVERFVGVTQADEIQEAL